jgi:hypothetical protein
LKKSVCFKVLSLAKWLEESIRVNDAHQWLIDVT